jgi:beta-lactamase class A
VRRALALTALVLAAAAPASAAWKPHLGEAAHWAAARHGRIAFAVRTPGHAWGRHARRTFPSASVLKPMLLVSYLNKRSVRRRALGAAERRLLSPMIRRSDNAAASAVLARVGAGGLRALARRAHMRRFTPVTGIWGLSRIDAEDQARFFLSIDRLLPARHRAYGMRLLERIVGRQRWGIARVRPRGWKLYFKGGWGSGTGAVDHQVALLVRGERRVSVAILTYGDGSHAYGKATLRGVARRLLRGLALDG